MSTGMLADENSNCGKALQVGIAAMKQIECMIFSETLTIRNKSVCINPIQVFRFFTAMCALRGLKNQWV
ncbi:hypothetical protein PR048_008356 [Dryococelus australis]|uniref:Uncharacterized protein n=1 Tax=Dryococelus australis TaxID=614101 RepID=A0ABQ9HX68_9NEOP|nr:hypothetical protein PR048_008356 [Dryococelus australis]